MINKKYIYKGLIYRKIGDTYWIYNSNNEILFRGLKTQEETKIKINQYLVYKWDKNHF